MRHYYPGEPKMESVDDKYGRETKVRDMIVYEGHQYTVHTIYANGRVICSNQDDEIVTIARRFVNVSSRYSVKDKDNKETYIGDVVSYDGHKFVVKQTVAGEWIVCENENASIKVHAQDFEKVNANR